MDYYWFEWNLCDHKRRGRVNITCVKGKELERNNVSITMSRSFALAIKMHSILCDFTGNQSL